MILSTSLFRCFLLSSPLCSPYSPLPPPPPHIPQKTSLISPHPAFKDLSDIYLHTERMVIGWPPETSIPQWSRTSEHSIATLGQFQTIWGALQEILSDLEPNLSKAIETFNDRVLDHCYPSACAVILQTRTHSKISIWNRGGVCEILMICISVASYNYLLPTSNLS